MKESDQSVNNWVKCIESIEIDSYKRKILNIRKSLLFQDELSFVCELDDLKKDDSQINNYTSKLYTKWAFDLTNFFIKELKDEKTTIVNSSNWTQLSFRDENGIEYANFEYRIFSLNIKINLPKYLQIVRKRKLSSLGF